MLGIQRILIARDSSSCSDHALNEALFLAGETGAELHVLHVDVLLGTPVIEQEDLPGEVQEIKERLQELAQARSASGRVIFAEQIRIHDVTERALSPYGRTGLRRLLMGSVAKEVARTAACPVLTVHTADNGEHTSRRIESVLVPIDFSDGSRQALR
jgi:nucleotide-binding universal stress UspA family protein